MKKKERNRKISTHDEHYWEGFWKSSFLFLFFGEGGWVGSDVFDSPNFDLLYEVIFF